MVHWNADDEMVLNKLRNAKAPLSYSPSTKLIILRIKMIYAIYYRFRHQGLTFAHIVPISAQRGNNVHQLEKLFVNHYVKAFIHFPEDYVTDRSTAFYGIRNYS